MTITIFNVPMFRWILYTIYTIFQWIFRLFIITWIRLEIFSEPSHHHHHVSHHSCSPLPSFAAASSFPREASAGHWTITSSSSHHQASGVVGPNLHRDFFNIRQKNGWMLTQKMDKYHQKTTWFNHSTNPSDQVFNHQKLGFYRIFPEEKSWW